MYAGDIFDKWNSSAALINFALDHLPEGYAVPGQHDLPLHNYADIEKSAYWTLVRVGKLINLKSQDSVCINPGSDPAWWVHGVPWGSLFFKPSMPDVKHLAVVHSYIWYDQSTCYPGAPAEKHYKKYAEPLKGYHAAVFGDNHKGFLTRTKHGCWVYNNGSFMRRKSDEKDYQPTVGLLHSDGQIVRIPLECKDKWEDTDLDEKETVSQEVENFMEFLAKVGDVALDFGEAVKRYLDDNRVGSGVRKLVMQALEE